MSSGRKWGGRVNRRRGACLLLLVTLTACAVPPRRPVPALSPEARALVEALEARWREFQDLQGLVDMILARREEVRRFSGPLLLRAPASLRFEALSPLGQPLLVVVMDGEEITLYSLGEDRALVGPATERTLNSWLNLPLSPGSLVSLLAGYVRPIPDAEVGVLVHEGGDPRLDLERDGRIRQRIWFDPGAHRVRQAEWVGGRARIQARLGADGSVTVAIPERLTSLQLTYRQRAVGLGLPPDRFRVALPEGTPVTRFP